MDASTPSLPQPEPLCLPVCLLVLHESSPSSSLQSGFGDMVDGNGTAVMEFVLQGFSGLGSPQGPLFWGVLCIYLVTLLGS